jgi:hypothetical protein
MGDNIDAANDACDSAREIVVSDVARGMRLRHGRALLSKRDRCHKAVPSPGDRGQKPIAIASVTQRPTQPSDLDFEVVFLNDRSSQARAMSSPLLISSPGRSTSAIRISRARLPL